MKDENRPLVAELAYILYKRNCIELRRRRAKSKFGYYEQMKDAVKDYKASQSRLNLLVREINVMLKNPNFNPNPDFLTGRLWTEKKEEADKLQDKLDHYDNKAKMRPKKWMNKISELNKQILRYRAEYMVAKYDTARLTCQTRKRVARLTALLQCWIDYNYAGAFVDRIRFKDGSEAIEASKFEAMYREHDATKAIEKMLKSNAKPTT